MDSMRNLHTSLPRPSRHRRPQPNAEVLQAFKAAALSVTQLYKNATADLEKARETGYQDALDDILGFLDQQNIGLGDGEGWRVRQWATERLSPSSFSHTSDGEDGEPEERARTATPPAQHAAKSAHSNTHNPPSCSSTQVDARQGGPLKDTAVTNNAQDTRAASESSTSQPEASTVHQTEAMDSSDVASAPVFTFSQPSKVDFQSKPSRHTPSKQNSTNSRDRSGIFSLGTLGHGAGSKRKQNLGDFFDISGIGGKESNGSSKKGRFG